MLRVPLDKCPLDAMILVKIPKLFSWYQITQRSFSRSTPCMTGAHISRDGRVLRGKDICMVPSTVIIIINMTADKLVVATNESTTITLYYPCASVQDKAGIERFLLGTGGEKSHHSSFN